MAWQKSKHTNHSSCVSNFSDQPQTLSKHQNLGILASTPTVIYHRAQYADATTEEDKICTKAHVLETEVSVSKLNTLGETFEETANRHQSIQDSDKEHVDSNWRDVVNISAKYEKYKPKSIETLE